MGHCLDSWLLWLHNSCFEQICHISPSLVLLVPRSLQAYRHFFFSEGMCVWRHQPCLPSPWLGYNGDCSPSASAAPSSGLLVRSSYLIRCQAVQVYHHLFQGLCYWCVFFRFRGADPSTMSKSRPVAQWKLDCSPCDLQSLRFCLTVLLNALSSPRHSCSFRPRSVTPLLHSGCALHLLPNVRLCLAPDDRSCCAEQEWRATVCGWWPTSAGDHDLLGSISLAVCCTLMARRWSQDWSLSGPFVSTVVSFRHSSFFGLYFSLICLSLS
jgi:hypothetical protein